MTFPGETDGEARQRRRAERAEGQRDLLLLLVIVLAGVLVGLWFRY